MICGCFFQFCSFLGLQWSRLCEALLWYERTWALEIGFPWSGNMGCILTPLGHNRLWHWASFSSTFCSAQSKHGISWKRITAGGGSFTPHEMISIFLASETVVLWRTSAVNGRHTVAPPGYPGGIATLEWAVWLYKHHFSHLDPWEVRNKNSLHIAVFQLIIRILEPNSLKIDRIYWGDWREKENAHWPLISATPY